MNNPKITGTEDKQHICDLLAEALKATRGQSDLVRIRYERIGQSEEQVVLDYEGGGHVSVNVSMDSGTAMIRDIVRCID